jgi:putative DNA primase/helicase
LVDLREAIASIDFMDRDAWVRAGMALKELGQTGYEIWCSGFDRIGVYPKGSRDLLPIKWREFKPGSGLHYESVFGMAQSNGWKNPKAKHAHDDDDFVIDLSDIPSYREIDTSEEVIHVHGGLGIQDLDTIRPENIDWLWPGWIPRQMLIVIGGDPGCGKTMICCSIAACITNRVPFPDGYILENPERVLMMTTEDDLKKTIAPRMYAAGVDPSMVSMLRYTMGNNNSPTPFNPKTDIPLIAKAFKERPFGLLILDSLADCISGDSNKNEDVRASLNVLSQMAEHCGFGVLGVLHQAKGSAGQKASMRLLGSVAFSGKPRSVISACKGENGADSVMVMSKTNITNPDKGFSYGMDSMDIVSRGDTIRDCFHIKWGEYFENGATAVLNTAEGVVAAPGPRAEVSCKDATDWIIESLQDGPVTCDDLNADAAMCGITLRTFERARAQLRKDGTIQSQRRFDNKVEWCLV